MNLQKITLRSADSILGCIPCKVDIEVDGGRVGEVDKLQLTKISFD